MTKSKCNLIILGEDHSEPQAKEMTLALLKASRDKGNDNRVIFAYEAESRRDEETGLVYRGPHLLEEMWAVDIVTQQHLKELLNIKDGSHNQYSEGQSHMIEFYRKDRANNLEALRYKDSKGKKNFLEKVNAEIDLFEHVLQERNNIEYVALEDQNLREECYQYIKRKNPTMPPDEYYQGLVPHFQGREQSMADNLRDCLLNSKLDQENNEIFVVLLVGADHAKNMESLLKAKMQDDNFDIDVTNIIVGKSSHSSAIEKYREGDIDHSVNGYLKVKKVDYKPSEDGVGRIEILHKTRGDSLSESEEQCALKLESIFGEDSVKSFKRPQSSIICGGSDEYFSVYPAEQDLAKNPSAQTSAVEFSQIAENQKRTSIDF